MPRPSDRDDDTPIYQAMLNDRDGRAPGELVDYLSAPWETRRPRGPITSPDGPVQSVRAMYRVDPIPAVPESPQTRVRPYVALGEPVGESPSTL